MSLHFAFIQTLSRLFSISKFVKCRRIFLELNSWGLFTGPPRRIRKFHFVAVHTYPFLSETEIFRRFETEKRKLLL